MTTVSTGSTPLGNTKPKARKRERLRKCCFTIHNWTPEHVSTLSHFFQGLGETVQYFLGDEIGESGNTPHLQCYFISKNQISLSTLQKLVGIKFHYEEMHGTPEQSYNYCIKENRQFWTNIPKPRPSDNELLAAEFSNITWKPWQQEILNIYNSIPDRRTIHWYWEDTGNQGKSFITAYLKFTYPEDVIFGNGKANDIFYKIIKLKEKHNHGPKLVILDITREKMEFFSWSTLEYIKSGIISSGKYESEDIVIPACHIIVLANSPPKDCKWSDDRLKEHKILTDY